MVSHIDKINTLHRITQDLDNFDHVCWVYLPSLSSHCGLRKYSENTVMGLFNFDNVF